MPTMQQVVIELHIKEIGSLLKNDKATMEEIKHRVDILDNCIKMFQDEVLEVEKNIKELDVKTIHGEMELVKINNKLGQINLSELSPAQKRQIDEVRKKLDGMRQQLKENEETSTTIKARVTHLKSSLIGYEKSLTEYRDAISRRAAVTCTSTHFSAKPETEHTKSLQRSWTMDV